MAGVSARGRALGRSTTLLCSTFPENKHGDDTDIDFSNFRKYQQGILKSPNSVQTVSPSLATDRNHQTLDACSSWLPVRYNPQLSNRGTFRVCMIWSFTSRSNLTLHVEVDVKLNEG